MVRNLLRTLARIVVDENLDLWLLAGAAMVFTVLGIVGLTSQATLSAATVALLAFMAAAQDNVAVEITSWVYAANAWQPTLRFSGNYVKSRKQLQLTSTSGYSEVWDVTAASSASMSLRSERYGNVVWQSCNESSVWPSLVRASTRSCR